MTISWTQAVAEAVRRHVAKTGSAIFTRQELIDSELDQIVADTGSKGQTPAMTLSRELQEMRDRGEIVFIDDHGTYQLVNADI